MLTARFTHVLESPWLQLEPLQLGVVPAGLGEPFAFVLVAEDERPVLRLDLHPGEGCFFSVQAIIWNGLVAVGIGTCAFLVNLRTRAVTALDIDGYFSSFWSSHEVLLAIDATGIIRVGKDGAARWLNRDLGIDGVEILEVKDGVISGSGCIDPPEGWESFALSLETGCTITST